MSLRWALGHRVFPAEVLGISPMCQLSRVWHYIDEQEPGGGLLYDARFYQGKRSLRFLFKFLYGAVAEFLGESRVYAVELVRQVSLL